MKSEAIADEARRPAAESAYNDAVRRLREESRRRINLRRPGMSMCILGTMVSLLLFVALEARRQFWVERTVAAQADAERARATLAPEPPVVVNGKDTGRRRYICKGIHPRPSKPRPGAPADPP